MDPYGKVALRVRPLGRAHRCCAIACRSASRTLTKLSRPIARLHRAGGPLLPTALRAASARASAAGGTFHRLEAGVEFHRLAALQRRNHASRREDAQGARGRVSRSRSRRAVVGCQRAGARPLRAAAVHAAAGTAGRAAARAVDTLAVRAVRARRHPLQAGPRRHRANPLRHAAPTRQARRRVH